MLLSYWSVAIYMCDLPRQFPLETVFLELPFSLNLFVLLLLMSIFIVVYCVGRRACKLTCSLLRRSLYYVDVILV
jgi:hypothetical protein